jgi:PPK2 family polyphosphate:nucleotide phosphotransferase
MDGQLRFVHELVEPLAVPPGRRVRLRHDFDPGYTDALASKPEAGERLSEGVALLADYQERLAAQDTYAVLLVVQGLDASGKDSTIKHVTSGVNPQGVQVHSFKQPSPEELDHDFLWRYQRFLPPRGGIGIYNRSHYEEVLVVRVHPELLDAEHLPPESRAGEIWERRFREINEWERYLYDNGIRVVKAHLNLSKREQAKRFIRRIERPEKNWKFSIADIREREHWDDYQKAYEQMLAHTSTEWAPWYVVPADHKWFARLATAAILIRALAEIDPQYPRPAPEMLQQMAEARALLEAETEADGSGSTGRTRGRDAASEG